VKYIKIALQVLFICLFNYIGEWIHHAFNVPIPGSIIGMLLLFILLITKIIPEGWVTLGANFFLTYMALFFIPATVGVMNYFDLFVGKGLLIILGVSISTCAVLISTGLISEKMGIWLSKKEKKTA